MPQETTVFLQTFQNLAKESISEHLCSFYYMRFSRKLRNCKGYTNLQKRLKT